MKISSFYGEIKNSGFMLLLALICIYVLTGCGKKGSLYLLPDVAPTIDATETVRPKNTEQTETKTDTPDDSSELKKANKKVSE